MEERLADRIARVTCTSNRDFVLEALAQGIRADGRGCDDCRPCVISPSKHGAGCQVEVQYGRTRILAAVTSSIVEPYSDKPNKGIVSFGVKLDWCATVWPACLCSVTLIFRSVVPFVKSDGSDIVLEALLQRAFIKSKAIDVEALCIYTGKRVWRLKVRADPCPLRPSFAHAR
jgi:exosome complex component RRP45